MLRALLVLWRARLIILKNSYLRGTSARITTALIMTLIGGGSWGLYFLMQAMVRGLNSPHFRELLLQAAASRPSAALPLDITPYLEALPSLVLFFALFPLGLGVLSTLLSALFLSGDMELLLSAPVPTRAVFVAKFFGGLLTPYFLLLGLGGPFLLGYGRGMGYNWPYFPVVFLVLLLLPLLPAGASALLVMVVVRIVPARRAREMVGILGVLLGTGIWLISQFSPRLLSELSGVRASRGRSRRGHILPPASPETRRPEPPPACGGPSS